MRVLLPGVAAGLMLVAGVSGVAHAGDTDSMGEAFTWLKKMAQAARQLNYAGTIVYQHRNHVETSRVAHFVNSAGGEFERLETLDGPPREVVRSNDQVVCYLPNIKTVLVEERNRTARNFPALVPESVQGLSENYQMRLENSDRVAGHDCRWVGLVPRDQLRYGRRFCAEAASGFPLRAQTLNEKGDAVESFAFTQITLGAPFNREQVRSRYADASRAQKWKVERSGFNPPETTPADTGWGLANPLAGFRKIMEGKRLIGSRGTVSQIVYSDGLAAISVFVEPAQRSATGQSLSHQGAVNIYTRLHGNHVVTVLGEAPAQTVMQIANSLEQKPVTAAVQ
jgi:sigma-E factor negative regulatory protein RseB